MLNSVCGSCVWCACINIGSCGAVRDRVCNIRFGLWVRCRWGRRGACGKRAGWYWELPQPLPPVVLR